MNDKYCKLIRKVAKQWGYSPKMAKRVKKSLTRAGITKPPVEFLHQIMQSVDKRLGVDRSTQDV